MEFSPKNPIVRLCLQGMAQEESDPDGALRTFTAAWEAAGDDFGKYLAAHYLARCHSVPEDRLRWSATALEHALRVREDESVRSALPTLYRNLAACYLSLGPTDTGPFFHGTRAGLPVGDQLVAGRNSNFDESLTMNHVYFTALTNIAGLAASVAKGDGPERVYRVQPTGAFEHDPNVTDQKFPGNPTRSYRSPHPLRIVAEVADWSRLSPEEIAAYKCRLAEQQGNIIN